MEMTNYPKEPHFKQLAPLGKHPLSIRTLVEILPPRVPGGVTAQEAEDKEGNEKGYHQVNHNLKS